MTAARARRRGIIGKIAGWDITSAVYVSTFLVTQDLNPRDVTFSPDGTKMFVMGSGRVYRYDL